MLTVWRLVEALPRFVDRFWFTFYLDPERSSDDVDDDGKRMGVWCREPAGRIGNFPRRRVPPLSAIERSIYRSCLDGKSRYSCSNGGRNYFVRMISLPGLPAIEPL